MMIGLCPSIGVGVGKFDAQFRSALSKISMGIC